MSTLVEVCQDDDFFGGPILVKMEVSSAQCPDGAVNRITICFLIDTDSLPPIPLVVQFHGGTICHRDQVPRDIPREAAEVLELVLGEEGDIPHLKNLCLL